MKTRVLKVRQYGLDLTEASLKEFALSQGLNSNIKEMTQAEKTMLRYQYVLAHTTAAQNDFSKTAMTWANQIRIMKQQLQQIGGTVGRAFINMLKPLVAGLNQALHIVNEFVEKVVNALGVIFGWKIELQDVGIEQGLDDAEGFEDALGGAADNAKKLKQQLQGFHELNVLNTDQGSGSGGGSSSSSGGGGNSTVPQYKIIPTQKDYASEIKNLNDLGRWIGECITDGLESIDWDSVYQGANNFGTGLANFLNGLISPGLFGAVASTIAGSLNTAIEAVFAFGDTFDFYNLGESIATAINRFFTDFNWQKYAHTLNTWVDGLWDTISGFFENIDVGEVLAGLFDFLTNLEVDTVITIMSAKWILGGGIQKSLETFLGGKLTGGQLSLVATIGFLSFKLGEWLSNNTIIGDLMDDLVEWLYDGGDTLNITKTISVTLASVALSIGAAFLTNKAINAIKGSFTSATVGEAGGGGMLSSIMGFLRTPVAEASLTQIGLAIAAGIAVGIGAYKWSEKNLSPYVYDWLVDNVGDNDPKEDWKDKWDHFGKWLSDTGNYDLTKGSEIERWMKDTAEIYNAYDRALKSGMSESDAMVVAMETANKLGAAFENLRDVHSKYTKTVEDNNKKLVKTNTTAEEEQRKALERQSKTWKNYSQQQSNSLKKTTSNLDNAKESNNRSLTSMNVNTNTCTTAMMETWKRTGIDVSQNVGEMGRNTSNTLSTTKVNVENSTKGMSSAISNNISAMVGSATAGMTNFSNAVNSGLSTTVQGIDSKTNRELWKNASKNLGDSSVSGITSVLSSNNSKTVVGNAAGALSSEVNKNSNKDKFKVSGSELAQSASTGIYNKLVSTDSTGGKGSVTRGVGAMTSAIGDSSSWVGIGNDLVAGLLNGITSKWGITSAVGSAANANSATLAGRLQYLAQNLTNALKNAFKIGSPSKIWRDEIGVWLPAGIGVGIEKSTPALLATVDNLGKAVNDEMSASIGSPEDLFGNSGSIKATVTANSNGSLADDISNGITVGMTSNQDRQNRLLQEQNNILLQILNKETGISASDIFNTVRQQNRAYYEQTGRQALLV